MEWKLTDKEIEAIPLTNFGGNFDDRNIAQAQAKKLMERLLKVGKWAEDADYIPGKQKPKRELCIKEKYIKKLLKEVGVE
jgi:hypothetical protein